MPTVAVIGAGPAGSVAALLLARGGVDVTIIEQHRFPRDKVCGECLSALGIDVLGRLQLSAALQLQMPAILRRCIVLAGNVTKISLPRPMWGISRAILDQFLLDAAKSAGAAVLQPARCESIDAAGLVVRDLSTNQLRTLAADHVLLADGKAALLPHPPPATCDYGLKAHFAGVAGPADAILLFAVHGHYGGIAPIENGRWNVAFSVPLARFRKFGPRHDALFDAMLQENAALQRQMRPAKRISDWLVCPLPRFAVRRHWPASVIPIGNAAAAIEPIGGEGMGLAMRSAELAARCLLKAIESRTRPDAASLAARYNELWQVRSIACRTAAVAISMPVVSRVVIPLLAGQRGVASFALRAMGKC